MEKSYDMSIEEKYAGIMEFCTNCDSYRGIWKRIDENRELLAFLQEHQPDLLTTFSFIEGWIAQQDMFLVVLAEILQPPKDPGFKNHIFPRTWNGSYPLDNTCQELLKHYAPTYFANHSAASKDT